MPILPPENNDFVVPPTEPEDPPNVHDVASAIRYEARIIRDNLRSLQPVKHIIASTYC